MKGKGFKTLPFRVWKGKNMNNENKPVDQIYRLDARSAFVECLSDSFKFGQAHLRAIKYDKTNEAGSRITDKVDIYIPVADIAFWKYLCESGKITDILNTAKAQDQPLALLRRSGGTGVKKLADYGRARSDGMAEFRSLCFKAGMKSDLLLIAELGPGKEDEKGLIQRAGRAEQFVQVPMCCADLYRMLWTVHANYEAFLAAKYSVNWQVG